MENDCTINEMIKNRPYVGVGQMHRAFLGNHDYRRLSLGVGLPKEKQLPMLYLTSQTTSKEDEKYKRMFLHFYQTYIESLKPILAKTEVIAESKQPILGIPVAH